MKIKLNFDSGSTYIFVIGILIFGYSLCAESPT